MPNYSNRTFECPYYRWSDGLRLRCEGARMDFPTRASINAFTGRYCCADWRSCSTAKMLEDHYYREDKG